MTKRPELEDLLKKSVERVAKMTPEEREEMMCQQRESYARSELSWPKPKFRWENGVKVYDSYEDYCND